MNWIVNKVNNMSMKTKSILVLFLASAMTIAVVSAIRFTQIRDQQHDAIVLSLRSSADLAIGVFETVMLFTARMANIVATMPDVEDALVDECGHKFGALDERLSLFFESINDEQDGITTYVNIHVYDAQLNRISSAIQSTEEIDLTDPIFAGNIEMARKGQGYLSPAFRSYETDLMQFLFSQPVMVDGEFVGLVTIITNTEAKIHFLRDPNRYNDSFINVADSTGVIFFSNRAAYVGRHVDDLGVYEAFGEIPFNTLFEHQSAITNVYKIAYISIDPLFDWVIVNFIDADDVENIVLAIASTLIPTVTAVVIIAAVLLFMVQRTLNPLVLLAKAAKEVGKGNLDVVLSGTKNNDEIAQVSRAFSEVISALRLLQGNYQEARVALSHKDVLFRLEDPKLSGIYDELLNISNGIIDEFKSSLKY